MQEGEISINNVKPQSILDFLWFDSKNNRIFTLDMTSRASRKNSAPGEVFEFLYGLNSLNMHKKQVCFCSYDESV